MAEVLPERAEAPVDNVLAVCEDAFSRAYQAEFSLSETEPGGHFVVCEAGMKERIRLRTTQEHLDVNLERLTLYSNRADSWWVAFWINQIDRRPPDEVGSHPPRLSAHTNDPINIFRAGQDGDDFEPISLEDAASVRALISGGQPIKITPISDPYF